MRNEEFISFLESQEEVLMEGQKPTTKLARLAAEKIGDFLSSGRKVAKKEVDDVAKAAKKEVDDIAKTAKKEGDEVADAAKKKKKKSSKLKKAALAGLGGAVGALLGGDEDVTDEGESQDVGYSAYEERLWPTNFYNPGSQLNQEQTELIDSSALFGGSDMPVYLPNVLSTLGTWNPDIQEIAEKRYSDVFNYWNAVYKDGFDDAYDSQMDKGAPEGSTGDTDEHGDVNEGEIFVGDE